MSYSSELLLERNKKIFLDQELKDLIYSPDLIRINTKDGNIASIFLQQFISKFNRMPCFTNILNIVNETKYSYEVLKKSLENIDFRIISAESDKAIPFYEFLYERISDSVVDFTPVRRLGFYLKLDCNVNKMTSEVYKKNPVTLYRDHIIPFLIEKDDIKLLPVNDYFDKAKIGEIGVLETDIKYIFISGDVIQYNETLVNNLKKKLDIKEEITPEHFLNNEIVCNNNNRTNELNFMFTTDDVINFNFHWFFTIDFERQKNLYLTIIENNVLEAYTVLEEAIESLSELVEGNNIMKKSNYNFNLEQSLLSEKNLMKTEKYVMYKINPEYIYLFNFIFDCHNFSHGCSDTIYLPIKEKLDINLCKKRLESLHKIIENALSKYFIDMKKLYDEKRKSIYN